MCVKYVEANIHPGVINGKAGKAGKAAALPKFSDTLTLSQPRGADYAQQIGSASPKVFCDYAPVHR